MTNATATLARSVASATKNGCGVESCKPPPAAVSSATTRNTSVSRRRDAVGLPEMEPLVIVTSGSSHLSSPHLRDMAMTEGSHTSRSARPNRRNSRTSERPSNPRTAGFARFRRSTPCRRVIGTLDRLGALSSTDTTAASCSALGSRSSLASESCTPTVRHTSRFGTFPISSRGCRDRTSDSRPGCLRQCKRCP